MRWLKTIYLCFDNCQKWSNIHDTVTWQQNCCQDSKEILISRTAFTMDCANFCRLCAEFRSNQQLTPLDDPDRCIRTKLFRCSQINLPLNDSLLLPQSVCDECIEKLEQSWSFANAVTEAQNKLQSIFAEDPLADIKIKEEIVTNSPCQLLDDHDYTDIR